MAREIRMAAIPGNIVPFDSIGTTGNDEPMRRAVRVVRRTLAGLPETTEVRRLLDQSEALQDQIDRFPETAPLSSTREQVMRGIVAIHLEAMRLAINGRSP